MPSSRLFYIFLLYLLPLPPQCCNYRNMRPSWSVFLAVNLGPCACQVSTPPTELPAQLFRSFLQTLLPRLIVLTLALNSVKMTVSFTYMAQNIKGTRDRTLNSQPHKDYCIWSKLKNNYATTKEIRTLNHRAGFNEVLCLHVLLCWGWTSWACTRQASALPLNASPIFVVVVVV